MEEIGTILMVAILVAIVGIVAAYLYGFPSSLPKTKTPNIQMKRISGST